VQRGSAHLCSRAAGRGPVVAFSMGAVSGLTLWEHPLSRPFFDRVAQFGECIVMDPRGTGGSDPVAIDGRERLDGAADFVAVLDAHGVDRAFVVGMHAGACHAIEVAARFPDRVAGLFIVNGWARLLEDDDYPGLGAARSEELIEAHASHFGTGMFARMFAPSRMHDPRVHDFFATIEQRGTSRAQAVALARLEHAADVRPLLPRVEVPTIVMHNRRNAVIPPRYGRYIADRVASARYVEFAGTDHTFFLENPEPVLAELETFVTGLRPRPAGRRTVATMLFTDIVRSTERAASLGDRTWRHLLGAHRRAVRSALERHGGHEINTSGDGFLAYFDTPGAAIDCGLAAIEAVDALGIEIRAGVHTGECEWSGNDLEGIAVHIGARVARTAGAGELLVSRTVKDLVAGSGKKFVDRGSRRLKGVPDEWELFAVAP
jgi:class 3 adenylate cyclase